MSANRRVTSSATTGRWMDGWQWNNSCPRCWGISWKLPCFIRSSPYFLPPIIMMWEATGEPMSYWVQTSCLIWFNTRPAAWPESSAWDKGTTIHPVLFESIWPCQVVRVNIRKVLFTFISWLSRLNMRLLHIYRPSTLLWTNRSYCEHL